MSPENLRPIPCEHCEDGPRWVFSYGGNDPGVWAAGPCPVCNGTGEVWIEVEDIEMEDLP